MKKQSVERTTLEGYLASALDISRFHDYCPNGVQVEGRSEIKTLVTGVTASLDLIEAARDAGADAILVHHGYFWRGEDPRVVGQKQRRLKLLLENGLTLFAYHLPLDMHREYGNNVQLAKKLGLLPDGNFGEDGLGWLGRITDAQVRTVGDLARRIGMVHRCGAEPVRVCDRGRRDGLPEWRDIRAHGTPCSRVRRNLHGVRAPCH
jgi:putative NIF3 family GTP cyclohydrolase 1 type 2